MNQANKDEAAKAMEIARSALERGQYVKAKRFAEKSMKLFPNDEVRMLLRNLEAKSASTAGPSTGRTPSASATQHNDSAPRPSAPGIRHRHTSSQAEAEVEQEQVEPEDVTQEQRDLVSKIRQSKDYYDILSVSKTASDDDIKKAYRKLALKLHPDKNKAKGSDEAFKLVSKAFSCLSDSEKRGAYDRYGHEDGAMAARQQQAAQGRQGGAGVYYTDEAFDPEEIFNMFFGGGQFGAFGHGHTRVFRTHFGGTPQQHRQQQQQQQQRQQQQQQQYAGSPMAMLMQLLPVMLILVAAFFNTETAPVYMLSKTSSYPDRLTTTKHDVAYYVKLQQFNKDYPEGSQSRKQVEAHVERTWKEHLEERCYQERIQLQRLKRWDPKRAKDMSMPNCEEINRIYGVRYWNV